MAMALRITMKIKVKTLVSIGGRMNTMKKNSTQLKRLQTQNHYQPYQLQLLI